MLDHMMYFPVPGLVLPLIRTHSAAPVAFCQRGRKGEREESKIQKVASERFSGIQQRRSATYQVSPQVSDEREEAQRCLGRRSWTLSPL